MKNSEEQQKMLTQLNRQKRSALGMLSILAAFIFSTFDSLHITQAQTESLALPGTRVITQQAKLALPELGGGNPNDQVGASVAISDDGNTAVALAAAIGFMPDGAIGSAYVFTRSGDTWTQQTELVPAGLNEWDTSSGADVAISGDGNTILFGVGRRKTTHVFVRSGNTWTHQAALQVADDEVRGLGYSVSLSDDGNRALVYAERTSDSTIYSSAAYVFVRSGNTWSQQAKLTPSENVKSESEFFTATVDLSGDGNTAMFSGVAPSASDPSFGGRSYVFVFTRSGNVWTEQAVLSAADGSESDGFGQVAVSDDGNTALIGARYTGEFPTSNAGSVYYFTRSGSVWTEQAQLIASDPVSQANFGSAVSISDDGFTALITAPNKWNSACCTRNGMAYIFTRSGSTWTEAKKFQSGDNANGDTFGNDAALSGNGSTALVGAKFDSNAIGFQAGSAYVFIEDGADWEEQAKLTAPYLPEGENGDQFGYEVVLSADGNTALIGSPSDDNQNGMDAGAVYAYSRSGSNWSMQTQLLLPPDSQNSFFGHALALSDDGNTALIGGSNHAAGISPVSVYTRDGGVWSLQQPLPLDSNNSLLFNLTLSGDGNTAVIGYAGTNTVHILTRSGDVWTEQTPLTLTGIPQPYNFGRNLAVNADASLILVSLIDYTANYEVEASRVYVFARSGNTWTEQTQLTSEDNPEGATFGAALGLNADGSTAVIGALDETPSGNETGAAFIFTRSGNTWSQQAMLTTGDQRFGAVAALSASGDTALVGMDYGNAVYLFQRSGTIWTQEPKITVDDPENAGQFGTTVDLSADGNTLLVGSPGGTGNNASVGAAYVFFEDGTEGTATPSATVEVTPTGEATSTSEATATPDQTSTPGATLEPTLTATGTPDGVELLQNGGFEADSDSDNVPDGWTPKNAASDKQKCNKDKDGDGTADKIFAFEGNCAYQFKGGENSKLQQSVTVENLSVGDSLTLSGYVSAKGAVNTRVKVTVKYTDETLPKGKLTVTVDAETSDYQPFSAFTDPLSMVLAGEPAKLKVQLQNKGTSGKVRYDALSLLKGDGGSLLPLP
jgi:hypothetical protein